MSTYFPDQISCTSLAGTGHDDMERLKSSFPDTLGSVNSGTTICPNCEWGSTGMVNVCMLHVIGDTNLVIAGLDNWIEARDAGEGSDPKGVL